MQSISFKRNLFLMLFFVGGFLFAQDDDPIGSETVVVIKPYTPSVGEVFKIKEKPSGGDSLDFVKKTIDYNINSVPVASTFEPAKGRATNLERARTIKAFDSYVRLGFGSYTSALAEFYTNFEVNRTDNFGVFLNHNSSQGGIDEVELEDKFYDTDLNLNYASRQRNYSWNAEVGLRHQLFNWYGIPPEIALTEAQINRIDPQQNYLDLYAGANIQFQDSFFKSGKFSFSHFGDSFNSSEIHAVLTPTFEFEIAEELITTNIIADYLSGSFEQEAIDYGYFSLGINPSLLILRDDLSVNLGIAAFYLMNLENDGTSVFVYPRINASYVLLEEYFIAYAGLEGDLEQNSYNQLSQENPFISPTLQIAPTNKQYNAHLGIKGKITSNINYNLKASYISENNKPLFVSNNNILSWYAEFPELEGFEYNNSFQIFYDDLKTLSVFGELNFDLSRDFSLAVNAEILSYETDEASEAWNLPNMKASAILDYQIDDNWYAGANLFYRGERKDLFWQETHESVFESEIYNIDSYLDLNIHAGYRFNNQLSAFVRGNNLLGNNYESWMNYPVQGLQVMAGATYKFDF